MAEDGVILESSESWEEPEVAPPPKRFVVSAADDDSQASATSPPSSPTLMMVVIIILGLTLLMLVVFDGIALLENKTANDLNTLTSLIAGGFVGFLSPHVASAVKSTSGNKGGQ